MELNVYKLAIAELRKHITRDESFALAENLINTFSEYHYEDTYLTIMSYFAKYKISVPDGFTQIIFSEDEHDTNFYLGLIIEELMKDIVYEEDALKKDIS